MVFDFLAKLSDVIGMIGVILMLFAYFMINTQKMSVKQLSYQVLNFSGAGLVLFSLYFNWNLSAAFIETAWMVISLIGEDKIVWNSK